MLFLLLFYFIFYYTKLNLISQFYRHVNIDIIYLFYCKIIKEEDTKHDPGLGVRVPVNPLGKISLVFPFLLEDPGSFYIIFLYFMHISQLGYYGKSTSHLLQLLNGRGGLQKSIHTPNFLDFVNETETTKAKLIPINIIASQTPLTLIYSNSSHFQP